MQDAALVGRDLDSIVCALCHRAFRSISNTHLIRVHEFDPEHPIQDYKERFGLERAECEETRTQQIRSYQETLERQGRRWTDERVGREIRRRAERGERLDAKALSEAWPQLLLAARQIFGSWRRALEAAGVEADRNRLRTEWSEEKILARLAEMAREGRCLGYGACNRRGDGLAQAARRRFGTWDDALRAAGVDPSRARLRARWTEERVLEEIRALDPVPALCEVARSNPKLLGAAQRRWGTWEKAVEAAGRTCPRKGPGTRKWTPERILEQIRAWSAEGRRVGPGEVARSCGGIWAAARREFGTWGNALRAAGLEPAHREVSAETAPAPRPPAPPAPPAAGLPERTGAA